MHSAYDYIKTWLLVAVVGTLVTGAASLAQAGDLGEAQVDYPSVAEAIDKTMRAYHYNPAELEAGDYQRVSSAVMALARVAQSDEQFLHGFREIWQDGPFSHVVLNKARQSADDLADYLDTLRIGGGGAMLSWRGDVAILTVNTMMGLDTIEEIDAAYEAIASKQASALIIDLRENGGGAFAILPLVSHLLSEPVDVGSFVSQPWNAVHKRNPGKMDVESVMPWEGWSIKAFWADVQNDAITRIRFSPAEPVYGGPVIVLTSGRTASAAELATDALKSVNRAIIIGEKTAGEMLSQKMYDLPGGFQLSLPIADYYSIVNGRIEGVGIRPDLAVDAAEALDVALKQL